MDSNNQSDDLCSARVPGAELFNRNFDHEEHFAFSPNAASSFKEARA